MRPVCVKCGIEMKPIRNGVVVYHPYEQPELGPIQEEIQHPQLGKVQVINTDRMISPDHFAGRIDFVASGDKYQCPNCGVEIITGFGKPMVDYDYPQEFLRQMVSRAKETVEILRM